MKIIFDAVEANAGYIILGLSFLLILFLAWLIVLQVKFSKLKGRISGLFAGAEVKNLENLIVSHSKNLKILDKDIQELYNISNQINNLAFRGLHKVGFLRFNPFKDVGGNQSFAIALLNGKNNGIVISSLYTREGTRVYSKAIAEGKAEKFPLTEEEEQVIKMALASEPKRIN